MKAKFEEFIELAIPNTNQREAFKAWVKNVINGVKNDNALVLYGQGATGKSMISRILFDIIDGDCGYQDYGTLRTPYHRNDIRDSKLIAFTGYPRVSDMGLFKCLIEGDNMTIKAILGESLSNNKWPNVIIEANWLPSDTISRRSIIIQTERNEKLEDLRLADLKTEKDFIRDWFLK